MSGQPPALISCANCCSKCCHGVDLPDTLTGTFLDSNGIIPCLDGYNFTLLNRSLPNYAANQTVTANSFFPVITRWGQYTNVRSQFRFVHYGKGLELRDYYQNNQNNIYGHQEKIYWDDFQLDQASLPDWAAISPDSYPYPPHNQANWQIGSCMGRALYRPDLSSDSYSYYPSETAYSRTTLYMDIACVSNYAFSNPVYNAPVYRQFAVTCEVQCPAYTWPFPSQGYAKMSVPFLNLNYGTTVIQFACDPFYLEFRMRIPEYWEFNNVGIGPTRSTIGATATGEIMVIVTE